MPENTVSVARPTKWGNPFKLGMKVYPVRGHVLDEMPIFENADAVRAFRSMLALEKRAYPSAAEIEALRGKNLACWCPLDQPCHADVLLELANREIPA